MKTNIEHYTSLVDINFATWHKQGITCVLLDVDSTVTPWLETKVEQEIADKLADARKAGITHIALVTNANKRNVDRIADIASQIGADAYFMPQRYRERKPRPSLIYQAMETFRVLPEQTAMVGDKFSADVRAARRAEVAKVAWVDRLGDADHPYDRYIRRPVEKIIKQAAKTRKR